MNVSGKRIDWNEVKQRLKESQLGVERAQAAAQERAQMVYEERARQLAARRVDGSAPASTLRVLVFALGSQRFGLEFADLVQLLPFANCTPVPGAPPSLLGVTNIQGEIRSVVHLGRLLDLPDSESVSSGYILVLRKAGREIALCVERIDRIQLVAPGELAVPSEAEGGPASHFVRGLTPDKLRLLSTEAIFAHPLFSGSRETLIS